MKKVKIKFTKEYLTYKEGQELTTTISNADKLELLGVAKILKDKKQLIEGFETKEEPKKKRVRRTKAQIEADKNA